MDNSNPQPNSEEMPDDLWKKIIADDAVRREVTRQDHTAFFSVYLQEYAKYETSPFQHELFAITEDESIKLVVIEAFRNSAKTTIMGTSYPIWAILGKQQRKSVVLLAQTQQQARQYLANIKRELESNKLLRKDLGPFEEPNDEWRGLAIMLPKYDARISVASVGQSVRGLRDGPHRPDLIICDDLEDLSSVRSREGRNKLYDWLMGDIIPLGDVGTRTIVIGTRLHEDSLIMRLRNLIGDGKLAGIARSYPLISEDGTIAWPGKFPDQASIDALKASVDDRAWRREYLLQVVGDQDQIIDPAWIQYYDFLPPESCYSFSITAIDLAVSESERADYTAMVTARLYVVGDSTVAYILPNPINRKMQYPDVVQCAVDVYNREHKGRGYLLVETVGTQRGFEQDLARKGINVQAFNPGKMDKHTRLSFASGKIKTGEFRFARKGNETLITEMTHFGQEAHDDLADAFSMLAIQMGYEISHRPGVTWVDDL